MSQYSRLVGFCVLGLSHIRRLGVERGARAESHLLVLVADLSDDVVPSILPAHARLPVDDRPCTVARTQGLLCLALRLQRNVKDTPRSVTHLPSPHKAYTACGRNTSERPNQDYGYTVASDAWRSVGGCPILGCSAFSGATLNRTLNAVARGFTHRSERCFLRYRVRFLDRTPSRPHVGCQWSASI